MPGGSGDGQRWTSTHMSVVYFSVDENVACISMYIITGHECSHHICRCKDYSFVLLTCSKWKDVLELSAPLCWLLSDPKSGILECRREMFVFVRASERRVFRPGLFAQSAICLVQHAATLPNASRCSNIAWSDAPRKKLVI